MQVAIARIRAGLRSRLGREEANPLDLPPNCSWDAMRQIYEEQAERGIPQAIEGLEFIEQDRWPSTGRPRDPS